MGIRRRKHADVIDIAPVTCPACAYRLEVGDLFCRRCGTDLLDETRDLPVREPGPVAEPIEPPRPARRRRRLLVATIAALAVLAAVGGAFAAWTKILRPGVGTFDADVRAVMAIAGAIQDEQDGLESPSELAEFAEELDDADDDLQGVGRSVAAIESESYRVAAARLVDAAATYLEELRRLAMLPAAEINDDQYGRARELARALNAAFTEATDLRDLVARGVVYSPSTLTRVLANLEDYRERVLRQRARIIAANKARTERLNEVRAFTDQMDGIIARYTAARSEVADWIEGVDTYGATFDEAYQVLGEQTERRRQLRTELAALPAPPQFATAKQSLLGVMDQAVAALEAAYRGIEEYQWDFDYRYLSYDETPGWRTFQAQTAGISDRYAAVLTSYSAQKETVLTRLGTKTPLPKVPE